MKAKYFTMKKNNKGFSLLEILIVVALIGIVGMFAVPNTKDWISRK